MRPRAFAAAWTVFTLLAAPALLAADEIPPPPQPAPAQPAPDAPAVGTPAPPPAAPAPEDVVPAAEPAPDPAGQPAAQPPAPEPAAIPAQEEDATAPKPKDRRRPVARAAASATVNISDFEFSPTSVTVNVGDTVTWTNAGPTVHTATGSGFDTGNLNEGESASHTFTSAGTFDYICTPHPFMKASVTVAAASTGQGTDDAGSGDAAAGADDGPTLANTGADAWLLALVGAGLLSLGLLVRRRSGAA